MKVLMVENFLPSNRYTEELCREITKIVDVDVVCRTDAGTTDPAVHTIKVLNYRKPNKIGFYFNCLISMARVFIIAIKGRYNVIHIEGTMLPQIEFPIYEMLRRKHRKIVYTVHNVLPHEAKAADKIRNEKFYSKCDLLVVHNMRTKHILVDEYQIPEEKICITPHGTYHIKHSDTKADKGNVKTFLMFGMIRKYKGVDVLLEAIAKLPEEYKKKMKFIIAGVQVKKLDATPYDEMIKDFSISDCVEYDNRRIEDDELPNLFSKADACVFPYREIYGSGALLMAYSYGKPVIASDVPVFVEETDEGKTGILFESQNPDALAEALISFCNMSDEQIKGFTEEINRLVFEKYNWNRSAHILAKTYDGLIKNIDANKFDS